MDNPKNLFSDFKAVSKEEWVEKATGDLKGADFNKKLVWQTYDGFQVQPFYVPEDIQHKEWVTSLHNHYQHHDGAWLNYAEIAVGNTVKANEIAQECLKFGANGLLFQIKFDASVDFTELLKEIDPTKLAISFHIEKGGQRIIQNYFDYLISQEISVKDICGFAQLDVLENYALTGEEPDFEGLAQLLSFTQNAPDFHGLVIGSHEFVDSGANTSQEMAFLMNKWIEAMHKLEDYGISIPELMREVYFHVSISGDYFFEIAKQRALKLACSSILATYQQEETAFPVLSSSSVWSKTIYDPNVNFLRNTTEAMAAVLGGTHSLLIRPHNSAYEEPTLFSRRIALNVSNLLREESYLDKVVDPAAGSYYLENLTETLFNTSIALFKEIENTGGYMQAFSKGTIQKKIGDVRIAKEKDIASRKQAYVGSNRYPNLKEKVAFIQATDAPSEKDGIPLLVPQRAVKSFEKLRQRTQQQEEATSSIPKVYLALFGNLAMRKARATFSADFFGTAGFELIGEFPFKNVDEAIEASAGSQADIVVICSSDPEYAEHGPKFIQEFKSKAPDKELVLAGYPSDCIEQLKEAGLEHFIHVRSNAIEVLSAFQDKLFDKK